MEMITTYFILQSISYIKTQTCRQIFYLFYFIQKTEFSKLGKKEKKKVKKRKNKLYNFIEKMSLLLFQRMQLYFL